MDTSRNADEEIRRLRRTMRDLVAPQKEIRCRGEQRKNDPVRWRADISRLQSLLPSWRARTLQEGLAACVAGWRE